MDDVASFYTQLVGVRASTEPASTSQPSGPQHMPRSLIPAHDPDSGRAAKRAKSHHTPNEQLAGLNSSSALNVPFSIGPSIHPKPNDSKLRNAPTVQGFRSGGRMPDVANGLEVIPAAQQRQHRTRTRGEPLLFDTAKVYPTPTTSHMSPHTALQMPSHMAPHLASSRSAVLQQGPRSEQVSRSPTGEGASTPSSPVSNWPYAHLAQARLSVPLGPTSATAQPVQSYKMASSLGPSHHSSRPSHHSTLNGSGLRSRSVTGEQSVAASSHARTHARYSIPKDNIGFKLLKQSGWQEGTGLGAEGTGRLKPVLPHHQKGNQGIGFEHDKLKPRVKKIASSGQEVGGSGDKQNGASAKKIADIVAAELKAEDVDTKVKRHLQTMRQDKNDARGKAIQQYILRAFNEPDASVAPAPLAGPTNLTATNPLL